MKEHKHFNYLASNATSAEDINNKIYQGNRSSWATKFDYLEKLKKIIIINNSVVKSIVTYGGRNVEII